MNLMSPSDSPDDSTAEPTQAGTTATPTATSVAPASTGTQDSSPQADSSTAIDSSVGQSRAILRSLCAYSDPTPKNAGSDRVYCAKTMELLQQAYDDSYSSNPSDPAATTAGIVKTLCPTFTDNPLRSAGCCVREIMVLLTQLLTTLCLHALHCTL
jgi:hypothetical protein